MYVMLWLLQYREPWDEGLWTTSGSLSLSQSYTLRFCNLLVECEASRQSLKKASRDPPRVHLLGPVLMIHEDCASPTVLRDVLWT